MSIRLKVVQCLNKHNVNSFSLQLYTTISFIYLSFLHIVMFRPAVRSVARQTARPAASRSYAAHATPQKFDWQDPLNAKTLFTEEEIAISETAEAYCQERMLPRVLRKSHCPMELGVANTNKRHTGMSTTMLRYLRRWASWDSLDRR